MKKVFLGTSIAVILLSNNLYANEYGSTNYGGNSPYYNAQKKDFSNNRGGNNPYYNSQNNDYSNYRGGNDRGYNPYDNRKEKIYGNNNSYRNSSGMIINR